jgi:hypothetical protein
MRNSVVIVAAAVSLGACGQSAANSAAANEAANSAAAEKPRPAYCFFQDADMKAWKAAVDKDGNVVVTGKAYRQDPRYKALLMPAKITGNSAEVAPTITANDTGFAAPENWWDMSETIPNSQAVTSVAVKCGEKTVATLAVPREK